MISLSSLDEEFAPKKDNKLRAIYYLFFKHGITIEQLQNVPIPYIFDMLIEYNEEQKEIEKERKKNR